MVFSRYISSQQLDPPWTTDWMSQDARERLRLYGISPPRGTPAMRTCLLR